MSEVSFWITFVTEIIGLVTIIATFFKRMEQVSEGNRCLLRTQMLEIYYNHSEDKKMRQYQYENFVKLYEAYKALKGNSFIDKIYSEVQTWEIEL